MAPTKPFDLRIEVDTYVKRLDNNLLLNSEESDELRDHFHCQVEELSELGLSEAEAFEVSKMRFGERQLIQTEFHKAKPMKMIYRYLMVGLMLLFSIRLINTVVSYSSLVTFFLVDHWAISLKTAPWLDVLIKIGIVTILTTTMVMALKRGKVSRWLLFTIPFISIVGDLGLQFIHWRFMQYNSSLYGSIIGTTMVNSKIIMLISYLFLVGLFFVLWHRNGKGLRLST